MTRLFDNIDELIGPHLVATMESHDRLDAVVGYFNLRGWRDLGSVIDSSDAGNEPVARILVGMTAGPPHDRLSAYLRAEVGGEHPEPDIDGSLARERRDQAIHKFRLQLMQGLPSDDAVEAVQKLREQLVSGKVQVKLFTNRPLHAKAYICHRDDHTSPIFGYVGSSNLTFAGLKTNYELNVDVTDHDACQKLAGWFNDRWHEKFTIDITEDLIDVIDESWVAAEPVDPFLVYLKVCYLMSQDAREGMVEYSLPASIASQLLEYQISAVKTLARRVVTRGGAMLGDVVGLGKTITAVAVAMMLREDHGFSTLVICPKNLVSMWEQYLDKYEVYGRVVPYSMAEKKLADLRRHQFVIIDESHTLRSETRLDYQAIRNYISENDSRVLLLTATPYNKRYLDVANQLALYIDNDEDLGISPSVALERNPDLADKVDGKVSTLAAFRRSEQPADWRRLMSEHLVRRTRGFVRANFAQVDKGSGREFLTFADGTKFYFPERSARPLPHTFGDTDPARLMVSDHTLDTIESLDLPRYNLGGYIDSKKKPSKDDKQIIEDLGQSSGHLIGFTRTQLYKRLSSCGHSFIISLERHIARNELFLYAIDSGLALPVGSILEAMIDSDIGDVDAGDVDPNIETAARYAALAARAPASIRWVASDLFTPELRRHLTGDTEALRGLLDTFGPWDLDLDSKVEALAKLLNVDHPDEKVVVFSEYKDTVNYVAGALAERGVTNVAAVSGDTDDPTRVARRFAPIANAALLRDSDYDHRDLRVLVSTDVLSEGQNLQDAHIVVNYDLPWAIIRLIQRAGRVDRVGQEADTVLLYSFLPDDDVEAVLSLRRRIRTRLRESAQVFGSDEQFFGTDDEVATIEGLYSGTLEDEDDEGEVDASSYALQIWQRAEKEHPELAARARSLPDLTHATKAARTPTEPHGVVTYVRTDRGIDAFGYTPDGEDLRLLTSMEALRLMRAEPGVGGLERTASHFPYIAALVRGPLQRPRITAGKLRGVRARVWNRLNGSLDASAPDAERALDAMFSSPLTTEAETRLKQGLSRNNDDLAELVVLLHRDGRLVIADDPSTDPLRIVCSTETVRP